MPSADRSGIRWLLAELPELVTSGVLSQETADALRQHYSSQPPDAPRRIGFILSAILGSLLIGAGVVLLVAHNWDFLSRPVRCAIALTPLVLSQALGVFVLLRRNGSAPWREAAAILNVAAIGTAIALVGQTYQIQGDFARFILGWMLLLLGLPAFLTLLRQNRKGYGTLLATTALAIAAAFSLGQTDDIGAQSFWRCSFAAYWTIVYLVGAVSFNDWRPTRPHPFVAIGWIGILSLAVVLSFQDIWRGHQWQNAVDLVPRHYPDILAAGIQVAWVLAALLFGSYALWKKRESNLAPAAFTPIAVIAWVIAKQTGDPIVPSLLVNFFLLALGVYTLLRGIRSGRVVEANLGMLVIAILGTARFFDTDLEFVVKGVAFIAIGLGFLVTNLVVFKRKARA